MVVIKSLFSCASSRCFSSAAAANLKAQISEEIDGFRTAGTYKSERVITSSQDTSIDVEVGGVRKKVLNFCANNYLGLSNNPRVIQAGKAALDEFGAGLSSVRFICGTQSLHKRRLIATDGAFSMDGDIAPLQEICSLADKYNALVFTDECHATGFLGRTGRGTEQLCGVEGKVDVINSTLGKAMGGAMGGYTAGSRELVDLLRQRSRPYLFSNSLAPAVAGSAIEVFKILKESPDLAASVAEKARYFRSLMTSLGFTISGHPDHPICPVMLGDARVASTMAERLLDEGIYVIGFSYPVVPQGKARIRVQMSAAHTGKQIEQLATAFGKIRDELLL